MKKNSKTRIGGGAYRSLSQQPSGFTPILGLRQSEILKKKGFTLTEVLIPKRVSEIKNKVFNFRESKIKELFNLNKKLVAFTLAEVLITLAIIGVVAALTIPTVVAKYQKHQYYTQFMKMYNTLNSALSLAIQENGNPDSWIIDSYNEGATTEKYIAPFLKINKTCKNDVTSCVPSPVTTLGGGEQISAEDMYSSEYDSYVLILSDGSIVGISYGGSSHEIGEIAFTFDINGSKGPNVYGRDVFYINYHHASDTNKWGWLDVAEEGEDCDPNDTESWGSTCSQKLLTEGKMNY